MSGTTLTGTLENTGALPNVGSGQAISSLLPSNGVIFDGTIVDSGGGLTTAFRHWAGCRPPDKARNRQLWMLPAERMLP